MIHYGGYVSQNRPDSSIPNTDYKTSHFRISHGYPARPNTPFFRHFLGVGSRQASLENSLLLDIYISIYY